MLLHGNCCCPLDRGLYISDFNLLASVRPVYGPVFLGNGLVLEPTGVCNTKRRVWKLSQRMTSPLISSGHRVPRWVASPVLIQSLQNVKHRKQCILETRVLSRATVNESFMKTPLAASTLRTPRACWWRVPGWLLTHCLQRETGWRASAALSMPSHPFLIFYLSAPLSCLHLNYECKKKQDLGGKRKELDSAGVGRALFSSAHWLHTRDDGEGFHFHNQQFLSTTSILIC